MKEPSKEELRPHRDPLLVLARRASRDVANFNRLAGVYLLPGKRKIESGKGPQHRVLSVSNRVKAEDEAELRWGYSIEVKNKRNDEAIIKSSLSFELDIEMLCLWRDVDENKWHLRADIDKDRKRLAKLLADYGIEKGKGHIVLPRDHYLTFARNLFDYFHKQHYEK